jgi:hypothetical protein
MIRLLPASLGALATLLAAGLHAQDPPRECPAGRSEADGVVVTSPMAAHPSRAAAIVDSALIGGGYAIRSSPAGEGEWNISPRYTFVEGLEPEVMEGMPHPGVQLGVTSSVRGDSTVLEVGARVLCNPVRNGVREDEMATAVAAAHAIMLVGAIDEREKALREAGVDLAAAVERRAPYQIQAPDEVAGFRRVSRHDYEDPAAGVQIRYGREDESYVDLYVYPGTPPACDAACGAEYVNGEADGFVRDIPEMVRRGYYGRMQVRTDEVVPVPAGAPWLFGRHLVMDVELRGEAQESQYYLFAFPGYKVKVRATFPTSAKRTAAVQAFVDALLPAMVSGR